MEMQKLVIFQLGGENYGIDIKLVSAIEKVHKTVPIPNSISFIKGIMKLRGGVIPVCSLRNKFGLEEIENTDNTKFLVIKSGTMEIALSVDSVDEIHDIETQDSYEAPDLIKSPKTRYIDKIVTVGERLVVVLDTSNLLSDEELENIEKIIENH